MTVDDFEDRLRAAMATGVAAAGPPEVDRHSLVVRADHRRRRQRRIATAAAVVVVAGAVSAGWSLRPDTEPAEQVTAERTTGAVASASTGAAGVVVAEGELPVVEGPTRAYLGYGAGRWASQSPSQPTGPIFVRTLPDGTILSLSGNRITPYDDELAPRGDVPPWWVPPAQCLYTGNLRVAAMLPETVGNAIVLRQAPPPAGTVSGSATVVGGGGPTPTWLVLAQTPPGTDAVRATFPGGATDSMAPVDGLAALVGVVPEGADAAGPVVLTALAADGRELASAPARRPDVGGAGSTLPVPAGCEPPTELPAPGAEQPADPAAAEAAVRATWEAAFGRLTETPTGDLFDDPTGLAEAESALREQQGDLLDTVTVPVDGVVFADADTAYVEYTVNVPTLDVVYADRFAELVLTDGTWRVTRDSACALLATGGSPGCSG